jgi:hypothetical protein
MAGSHGSPHIAVFDAMNPKHKGRAVFLADLRHPVQQRAKELVPEVLFNLVAPVEIQDGSAFVGGLSFVLLGFPVVLVDEGISAKPAGDLSGEAAGVFVVVGKPVRRNEENPASAPNDFDFSSFRHDGDPGGFRFSVPFELNL